MSGRIVVGVDGSDGARAALAWGLDEARLRGAAVDVVHAWHAPAPVVPGPYGAGPAVDDEMADSARVAAERVLEHQLQAADTTGVEVEPLLPSASASDALIDIARGADLLVVGTRGRGGFAGLLLGSVSQQISHHAPCPVVIVPTPES